MRRLGWWAWRARWSLRARSRSPCIERHERAGLETSSHNSGVIHAGIYYPTGSLKHTLCIEGNRLLYEWADEHGVPAVRLGKLIIAVDETELDALEEVRSQAEANGVPGMSMIDDRGAAARAGAGGALRRRAVFGEHRRDRPARS